MSVLDDYRRPSPAFHPPREMWQVQLAGRGLDNLRLRRVKVPSPGERELLVRIDCVGLCASDYKLVIQGDLHTRIKGRDLSRRPVVPGHEVSFTIVQVGEKLKDQFTIGARATLQPDIYKEGRTMAYGYQLEGGLQQYQVIGKEVLAGGYLIPVSDRLGYAQVGLAEPWACVYHAYENHRQSESVKPGGITWLVGAGPLGLMHLGKAISSRPARIYVSELNSVRLARAQRTFRPLAEKKGVKLVCIDAHKTPVSEVIPPKGVDDIVILCPDIEVFQEAFNYIALGGFINVFAGFPDREQAFARLNLNDMHYGNITIIATSGSPISALKRALRDCEKGIIDPNNSVAAVGGIRAAIEGIGEVHKCTFPGKIVIYPQLDLPLTPIDALTGGNPWSNDAEAHLLKEYLSVSTNS